MLSQSSCSGRQRQRQAGEARHQQHQHLGDIAGEQIEDELADVVEDDASLFDRGRDRFEPVILQDDGGCLLGDVGAALAHRHPDVRLLQRRGVVDAVAEHRDDLAALLQRLDDQQLVLRRDPAEGVHIGDAAGELRRDS